jgi:hypothetical protein
MNRRVTADQFPERIIPPNINVLDRETFYRRYPPALLMSRLDEHAGTRQNYWLAMGMGGALAAAAAAVLLVLIPMQQDRQSVRSTPSPRIVRHQSLPFGAGGAIHNKGLDQPLETVTQLQTTLRFQVLRGNHFEPIREYASLHENDILRFYYDSVEADYLYLFSVDDNGTITSYYPEGQGTSIPIARGRNVPLPDGVQLDSYVGAERFFALFTSLPLHSGEVELAVRIELLRLHTRGQGVAELMQLPLQCQQVSLPVVKR